MDKVTDKTPAVTARTPAYPPNVLAFAEAFLTIPGATPQYVHEFSDLPAFAAVADAIEPLRPPDGAR